MVINNNETINLGFFMRTCLMCSKMFSSYKMELKILSLSDFGREFVSLYFRWWVMGRGSG